MIHHLWLFVTVELLFSATPGPAVMLVSATAFRSGMPAAWEASLGIQTGNAIYLILCALGLAALLAASGAAFGILRLAGAAYLIFLGVKALWQARTPVPQTATPVKRGRPYGQGVLTQLSNPKALLYFTAFLPQFLNRDAPLLPQYLLMFAVMAVGETSILGCYGLLAAQGRRFTGMAVWGERVSGAVLIAIGALFAVSRRA